MVCACSLSKSPSKRLKRQVTLRKIDRLAYDDIGQKVHAVILAGGQQDNPLARFRAMPAVEVGEATAASRACISTAQQKQPLLQHSSAVQEPTPSSSMCPSATASDLASTKCTHWLPGCAVHQLYGSAHPVLSHNQEPNMCTCASMQKCLHRHRDPVSAPPTG